MRNAIKFSLFGFAIVLLSALLLLPCLAFADDSDGSMPTINYLTTMPQSIDAEPAPFFEPAIRSTKSYYGEEDSEPYDIWERYDNGYIQISGYEGEFKYTGEEWRQELSLYDRWYGALYEGSDYVIEYENNVSAGTAYCNIYGIGKYKGGISVRYEIIPVDLSGCSWISDISDKKYTGKAIKQKPTVYCNGTVLREGTDYTVEYSDNVSKGFCTVYAHGKGNYTGTSYSGFYIYGSGWNNMYGGWKYMNSNGSWEKNKWKKSGGKWYHFDAYGWADTGWRKIKGKWYFFNRSSCAMKTGWIKDDGEWYYTNNSGVMQTGWKKIGKKWYFFKGSGAMASHEWCKGYWLDQSGAWTYKPKGTWHRVGPNSWWYGDSSGWYARDCYMVIDGYKYRFNPSGYWVGTAYKVS